MRVVERFVTSAKPDTVWKILADVEHWRDWTSTIVEVKPLTEGGLRTGARYRVTQPNLRPAVYEVSECVPREIFTWVQKFPGGGMVAGHRIAVRNGQTAVELSFCSKGLMADIISLLFSKTIRNYVATEASSLKRAAEARCLSPDT